MSRHKNEKKKRKKRIGKESYYFRPFFYFRVFIFLYSHFYYLPSMLLHQSPLTVGKLVTPHKNPFFDSLILQIVGWNPSEAQKKQSLPSFRHAHSTTSLPPLIQTESIWHLCKYNATMKRFEWEFNSDLCLYSGLSEEVWREIMYITPSNSPKTIVLSMLEHFPALKEHTEFKKWYDGLHVNEKPSFLKARDGVLYRFLQTYQTHAVEGTPMDGITVRMIQLSHPKSESHPFLQEFQRHLSTKSTQVFQYADLIAFAEETQQHEMVQLLKDHAWTYQTMEHIKSFERESLPALIPAESHSDWIQSLQFKVQDIWILHVPEEAHMPPKVEILFDADVKKQSWFPRMGRFCDEEKEWVGQLVHGWKGRQVLMVFHEQTAYREEYKTMGLEESGQAWWHPHRQDISIERRLPIRVLETLHETILRGDDIMSVKRSLLTLVGHQDGSFSKWIQLLVKVWAESGRPLTASWIPLVFLQQWSRHHKTWIPTGYWHAFLVHTLTQFIQLQQEPLGLDMEGSHPIEELCFTIHPETGKSHIIKKGNRIKTLCTFQQLIDPEGSLQKRKPVSSSRHHRRALLWLTLDLQEDQLECHKWMAHLATEWSWVLRRTSLAAMREKNEKGESKDKFPTEDKGGLFEEKEKHKEKKRSFTTSSHLSDSDPESLYPPSLKQWTASTEITSIWDVKEVEQLTSVPGEERGSSPRWLLPEDWECGVSLDQTELPLFPAAFAVVSATGVSMDIRHQELTLWKKHESNPFEVLLQSSNEFETAYRSIMHRHFCEQTKRLYAQTVPSPLDEWDLVKGLLSPYTPESRVSKEDGRKLIPFVPEQTHAVASELYASGNTKSELNFVARKDPLNWNVVAQQVLELYFYSSEKFENVRVYRDRYPYYNEPPAFMIVRDSQGGSHIRITWSDWIQLFQSLRPASLDQEEVQEKLKEVWERMDLELLQSSITTHWALWIQRMIQKFLSIKQESKFSFIPYRTGWYQGQPRGLLWRFPILIEGSQCTLWEPKHYGTPRRQLEELKTPWLKLPVKDCTGECKWDSLGEVSELKIEMWAFAQQSTNAFQWTRVLWDTRPCTTTLQKKYLGAHSTIESEVSNPDRKIHTLSDSLIQSRTIEFMGSTGIRDQPWWDELAKLTVSRCSHLMILHMVIQSILYPALLQCCALGDMWFKSKPGQVWIPMICDFPQSDDEAITQAQQNTQVMYIQEVHQLHALFYQCGLLEYVQDVHQLKLDTLVKRYVDVEDPDHPYAHVPNADREEVDAHTTTLKEREEKQQSSSDSFQLLHQYRWNVQTKTVQLWEWSYFFSRCLELWSDAKGVAATKKMAKDASKEEDIGFLYDPYLPLNEDKKQVYWNPQRLSKALQQWMTTALKRCPAEWEHLRFAILHLLQTLPHAQSDQWSWSWSSKSLTPSQLHRYPLASGYVLMLWHWIMMSTGGAFRRGGNLMDVCTWYCRWNLPQAYLETLKVILTHLVSQQWSATPSPLSPLHLTLQGRFEAPMDQLATLENWSMATCALEETKQGNEMERILAAKAQAGFLKIKKRKITEWQKSGVFKLLRDGTRFGGQLLCDSMGLGKTIQELMAALSTTLPVLTCGPSIILTTAPETIISELLHPDVFNMKVNYYYHDREKPEHVLNGKREVLDDPIQDVKVFQSKGYEIVIATYSTLVHELETMPIQSLFLKIFWNYIICDEASTIKNAKTMVAMAACSLFGKTRLAVTGTPYETTTENVWSLLKFARCPQAFMADWRRYWGDRFDHSLLQQWMVRREKTYLLECEKHVHRIYCPLPSVEAGIQKMVQVVMEQLMDQDNVKESKTNLLKLMITSCTAPWIWFPFSKFQIPAVVRETMMLQCERYMSKYLNLKTIPPWVYKHATGLAAQSLQEEKSLTWNTFSSEEKQHMKQKQESGHEDIWVESVARLLSNSTHTAAVSHEKALKEIFQKSGKIRVLQDIIYLLIARPVIELLKHEQAPHALIQLFDHTLEQDFVRFWWARRRRLYQSHFAHYIWEEKMFFVHDVHTAPALFGSTGSSTSTSSKSKPSSLPPFKKKLKSTPVPAKLNKAPPVPSNCQSDEEEELPKLESVEEEKKDPHQISIFTKEEEDDPDTPMRIDKKGGKGKGKGKGNAGDKKAPPQPSKTTNKRKQITSSTSTSSFSSSTPIVAPVIQTSVIPDRVYRLEDLRFFHITEDPPTVDQMEYLLRKGWIQLVHSYDLSLFQSHDSSIDDVQVMLYYFCQDVGREEEPYKDWQAWAPKIYSYQWRETEAWRDYFQSKVMSTTHLSACTQDEMKDKRVIHGHEKIVIFVVDEKILTWVVHVMEPWLLNHGIAFAVSGQEQSFGYLKRNQVSLLKNQSTVWSVHSESIEWDHSSSSSRSSPYEKWSCKTKRAPQLSRDSFQFAPEVQVLFTSVGCSGYGVTLTEARNLVTFESHPNPAVDSQADDRIHRLSQLLPHVYIYKLESVFMTGEPTSEHMRTLSSHAKRAQMIRLINTQTQYVKGGIKWSKEEGLDEFIIRNRTEREQTQKQQERVHIQEESEDSDTLMLPSTSSTVPVPSGEQSDMQDEDEDEAMDANGKSLNSKKPLSF